MGNRFPKQRATIEDVAARAGVSKATVSKCLNPAGDYYVSRTTRRKIEDAIAELDYQPNALAQSLTSQRTNAIGVLVASVANPFYSELVAGVEDVAGPAQYTLLLGSSEGSATREADLINSMIQRRVDGVVVSTATIKDRAVRRLVDAGVAVVVASREVASPALDTVVIDNQDGGRLVGKHLQEHGHPRVTYLSGSLDIAPFRLRLDGIRSVYGERADVVETTATDLETATAQARVLLRAGSPPDAIFAATDTMALGVLAAAGELGVSVPGELAVIGFDDIWVSRMPGVALTTVDSKAHAIGRTAAHLLTQRLRTRGGDDPRPQRMVLRSDLVVRRSCGC
ncbi:LacI family DNA-binding transcriptional regulator [Nonomuraea insulae]|uniref:LacI family DNA-binding transcriptional regulator n=1 Tax=Nonomuraea insulae TaxID=1616787 RepID=A0ABW1CNX1_9ACTN